VTPALLVVEDRRSLAAMLEETLVREGYAVRVALRGDEAVALLRSGERWLAVLTDLKLPGADGLEVLAAARSVDPELPVFLITAHASVATAVAALKLGARDYFQKPLDMDQVLAALRAATRPREALLAAVEGTGAPVLVGTSSVFTAALAAARRVAPTEATVLLLGASGTGKELFAQTIHWLSPRRSGPFVAFNCAAVPETLIEAELFGYERGAFTGATARRVGWLEQACGGTLLLDEIGEVPLPVQVKLLRALEERAVARLGGTGTVAVDVRLVAATNRDLEAAVREGSFRSDLYHRLSVFPIRLPALVERREDIPALAAHLLARAAARHGRRGLRLRPAAQGALVLAPWPGNVRELANVLERAAILAPGEWVGLAELGLDRAACLEGWRDEGARAEAVRAAGSEADELAAFLGVRVAGP
jgi:DNA-binding NtrC family response regulator